MEKSLPDYLNNPLIIEDVIHKDGLNLILHLNGSVNPLV
jgi:hypothetical protein